MTAYRRLRVPGGTYFFTLCLAEPGSSLLTDRIGDLRRAFATTLAERPVRIEAIVILPDHLHSVWTLPQGDADFSTRWRLIKARFSRATGLCGPRRASLRARAERGLWQRRFWEHRIRGPSDLSLHLRKCWLDPVAHGLVARAEDWPWTSLQREIRAGGAGPVLAGPVPDGCFGDPAPGPAPAPVPARPWLPCRAPA